MPLEALLASLPTGHEVARGRRGVLAAELGALSVLARAGFGPDGGESLPVSDLAGRAPLGQIAAEGERWIVRRFHHGGAFRALGERAFPSPARPFREWIASTRLLAAGVPTSRVVAARAQRDALGWRLALVSVRIEGAADGAEWLERWRRGELDRRAQRSLVEHLGRLVGALHRVGFEHTDLHPRNLLVSEDLTRAWVLDLDRGRFGPLSTSARRRNLRRLLRAVGRRERRAAAFLRRSDHRRFLVAYGRELGGADEWRSDWKAVATRDRLARPWHRLGWILEEWLGSGPGRRDGAAGP